MDDTCRDRDGFVCISRGQIGILFLHSLLLRDDSKAVMVCVCLCVCVCVCVCVHACVRACV